MKCENCNGTGYTDNGPYYPGYQKCLYCDGSGVEEPLTREEYIRNCTTEELVEVITEFKCEGYAIWPSLEEIKQDVREWLKEKME